MPVQLEHRGMLGYIHEQVPLNFDPALVNQYLQSFSRQEKSLEIFDELETYYDDLEDRKKREELMDVIGNQEILSIDELDDGEGEL